MSATKAPAGLSTEPVPSASGAQFSNERGPAEPDVDDFDTVVHPAALDGAGRSEYVIHVSADFDLDAPLTAYTAITQAHAQLAVAASMIDGYGKQMYGRHSDIDLVEQQVRARIAVAIELRELAATIAGGHQIQAPRPPKPDDDERPRRG